MAQEIPLPHEEIEKNFFLTEKDQYLAIQYQGEGGVVYIPCDCGKVLFRTHHDRAICPSGQGKLRMKPATFCTDSRMREGVVMTWIRSQKAIRIAAWYDGGVAIDADHVQDVLFCRRLGMKPKDLRRIADEMENLE